MNLAKLNRLTSIKATGNAFFSEKKYTKALDEYTRGISDIGLAVGRSTPTGSLYKEITVQLLSNRALVYQRLGKLKESIHDCKTALAHDPENVKVLYRLALAYETNQQLEEAFKHISMAKSHDRSSDKAVQRLYKKLETLVTSKEALEHVAAPRPLNRCLEKVYRCAVAACRTCKSVHPARRRGGAADSKGRSYAEEPSVLKPQIEIDEQKIDDLVTNVWMSPENKTVFLDQLELASQSVSRLPIDFQSQEEQINFYGVHAVCSFGMGFSREFRRMFRKPFEDVHTMAMLSMHMATSGHGGARGWDAKFMMGLEVGALASYFQLPLDREERMDAGKGTTAADPILGKG
jgi:tetratricopeptide (TPR) repeat protein